MNREQMKQEIAELKTQRNEFQKKVGELQQQIDTIELALQDITNFTGKCVYYKEGEFGCEVYVRVDSVSRNLDGIMLEGYVVTIYDDGSAEFLKASPYTVDYDDILNIEEISEEDFKKVVRSKINDIINNI